VAGGYLIRVIPGASFDSFFIVEFAKLIAALHGGIHFNGFVNFENARMTGNAREFLLTYFIFLRQSNPVDLALSK